MKKAFILILVIAMLASKSQAQNTAEQIAGRIAQKMKDSLSLSGQQKDSIYSINMQITEWKSSIRQQYTSADSLRHYLQLMENRRDSLYRNVLDETKYNLYKQKKRNLINNN